LTLGDNRRVDLSQTVIFMTSNLGGAEITELMTGGMGFVQPIDKPVHRLDEKVERAAIEAARRKFSPEFINRLDKLVVFHPLKRDELDEVLEIETRAGAEARVGFDNAPLLVPSNEGRTTVPARRGDRSAVRSAPPETCHRALSRLPTFQVAGHGTSALG